MSSSRDWETEEAERLAKQKAEESNRRFILRTLFVGWICFYVLTFFIWLGAIWASPLKLFFTGLLTLIVAIALTILYAFMKDEWRL